MNEIQIHVEGEHRAVYVASPNVTQSAGGFGQITSENDPRIGQLALKLLLEENNSACIADFYRPWR